MGKNIKIKQIDAFTNKAFSGNPAGVLFGEGLVSSEMQDIAKEMNLSETAFLTNSDKANFRLRWFTPTTEVELCGHATIASLHFLYENNLIQNGSSITFETLSGILKCKMENGKYFMQVPIYNSKDYNGNSKAIINSLGLELNDINENYPLTILNNGYLYIPIQSLNALSKVNPNYKELLEISDNGKLFTAAVPFTIEKIDAESFAHLRFFGPYYGIDEDPVTGSANGPLLLILLRLGLLKSNENIISVQFEQGDFINRKGRIGVIYDKYNNELYISGEAVTVLNGEMHF